MVGKVQFVGVFGTLILCVICVSSESLTDTLPSKESCPGPLAEERVKPYEKKEVLERYENEEMEKPYENCDFEDTFYSKYYDRADDIPDAPELLESPNDICFARNRCGYLKYDAVTRKPQMPFVRYCRCPSGLACVRVGENQRNHFFYYKCAVLTGFETGIEIGDISSIAGIFPVVEQDRNADDRLPGVHMDSETFREKLEELARQKVYE